MKDGRGEGGGIYLMRLKIFNEAQFIVLNIPDLSTIPTVTENKKAKRM